MDYQSTRHSELRRNFKEVVSEGLAPDGGLYVPTSIPNLSSELKTWSTWSYRQMAQRIYELYAGECLNTQEREQLLDRSLGRFKTTEVTPLHREGNTYILELFHGPTLSFKDVALQTLGGLFEHWPLEKGDRTIVGATSGDTGSAAIAGVQGKKGVRAFILFPEGRVSPVQELQMTTVPDNNIQCIGIQGSFDDCQNIVKELFSDMELRQKIGLSAVNSINWARITSQIVYYFFGYFQWLKQSGHPYGTALNVSVPTGNFGDILAGYMAKSMGLPLGKMIIASNDNDILTRFYETASYSMLEVIPSWSPAMDIQISSNFERLLYLLHHRNSDILGQKMAELKTNKTFSVEAEIMKTFRETFSAQRVIGEECLATIKSFEAKYGYTLDPHTAVGVAAAQKELGPDAEVMCLATAHPGKFQEAVEKALGRPYILPEELEALKGKPTRKIVLPASAEAVRQMILKP
jgi:threonine synthase